MSVDTETIIVGGGQAGLAMSHHLARRGREHVVLERGRIAERWQSERWDSLTFQFPNRMIRLPGYSYAGPEPDAFMGRAGIAELIIGYAREASAPVRCGIEVTSIRQSDRGTFVVEAGGTLMGAANVVIATGPYQLPAVPACASRLPPRLHQVTANRYRRPGDLPRGKVLVVGSGGSGCQIVEDLLDGGREVFYSVRRHRRVPRTYRGEDFGWWIEANGTTETTVDRLPEMWRTFKAPMLTGTHGGHTVDLRNLAARGVTLLGSLADVSDGRVRLAPDLNANIAVGDQTFVQFNRGIDEFVQRAGLAAPVETGFDAYLSEARDALPEIDTLDLAAAGITTVIWATGYRYDFGWVGCPVIDKHGAPMHRRGVTNVPGLYFLGLARLHKIKSAFLWGVGEDADFIADDIAARDGAPTVNGHRG